MAIRMGNPPKRSVEQSSLLLKRFYWTERKIMQTLSGYLVAVSDWELKLALPRHIWQDSMKADRLRTRVLEMRYPRRDVDQDHDPGLKAFLELLIRCRDDAELIEGAYFVAKAGLNEAYARYLEHADELDDGPTFDFLAMSLEQTDRQLEEMHALYRRLPGSPDARQSEWRAALEREWAAVRPLLGLTDAGAGNADAIAAREAPQPGAAALRPDYVPPLVPARDPKFLPAPYHFPPRAPVSFIEKQVWCAINHTNEIWASEIPGLLMWRWDDMPWDFYLDFARWVYDEARHARMGMQRLQAWGFEPGTDTPICADHYVALSGRGELEVMGLLHAFEVGAPAIKSALKTEFEREGDTASSQDFDFDWADESIHLLYGHKWLLRRLDGNLEALEELKASAMQTWAEYHREKLREWNYEPFQTRIDHRIKEIEANLRE